MSDPTQRCIVFFPSEDVSVKVCRSYAERMRANGIQRGIMVIAGKFSPLARQALDEMAPLITIEHFREEELLIDITEHELVPKHIPLSDAEKAALLDRYKLSEYQLPRVQVNDPVSRFLGLRKGQIVKIIRPSETAGRYVTYRIVI